MYRDMDKTEEEYETSCCDRRFLRLETHEQERTQQFEETSDILLFTES